MNPEWVTWIVASICKHFDDNKGSWPGFVEGQRRQSIQSEDDHLELRVIGPQIVPITESEWVFYIQINILVVSILNDTDLYKFDEGIGLAASILHKRIPIYKYGGGDSSQVGCLQLIGDSANQGINIFREYANDPKIKNHYAQVEATYRMTFT